MSEEKLQSEIEAWENAIRDGEDTQRLFTGKPRKMKITEGVMGMWHYHISFDDEPYRALCGAKVMGTSIPLDQWGKPFGEHFPKRPTYCSGCEKERTDYEQFNIRQG